MCNKRKSKGTLEEPVMHPMLFCTPPALHFTWLHDVCSLSFLGTFGQ